MEGPRCALIERVNFLLLMAYSTQEQGEGKDSGGQSKDFFQVLTIMSSALNYEDKRLTELPQSAIEELVRSASTLTYKIYLFILY